MFQSLGFFGSLTQPSLEWVLSTAQSRTVISDGFLVKEGSADDCIYFVADGLFDVYLGSDAKAKVAQLGAGAVIGEISWLDGSPPTASIRAAETSEVLALSYAALGAKLAEDTVFSADFYRALSQLVAGRLRESNSRARRAAPYKPLPKDAITPGNAQLMGVLGQFKTQVAALDRAILQDSNDIPALTNQLRDVFFSLQSGFDAHMRTITDVRELEEVGAIVQREWLPYVMLATTAERCYAKPRGYAGDFLTIEMMYQNEGQGAGRLGPILDNLFLDMPACHAVRNRRGLMNGQIADTLLAHPDREVHVTSMACGPARELFDLFDGELGAQARERLRVTCIDIDLEALALLDGKVKKRGLQKNLKPFHGNLIYLATGRQKLDQPPQDLMYSIGLIDYFNDPFVVRLMNWTHGRLAAGGRTVLGNFDPSNNCRYFMDYVCEWKLIHRTAAEMDQLYQSSAFAKPCSRVLYEEQKINLFAECVKA
jgi:extracellular factor (EF) 3-hydroxypalmitic acid methyl ester biosynthesis protein